VLVVDDDPDQRAQIAGWLAEEGCELTVARDGWETLRALEHDPPDAVLLDLRLPGVQGEEVLHALRRDPRLRRVPVVVATAKDVDPAELESELRDLVTGLLDRRPALP
jgi:CheY-like chemotaxis protein